MNKTCSKCNRELPVGAFGTFKKVPHGHRWCKECVNANHAEWRKTEAGKACDKRGNSSPEHKAAVNRYSVTEEAKALARLAKIEYHKTPQYLAYQYEYRHTDEYKAKVSKRIRDDAHKAKQREVQRKRREDVSVRVNESIKSIIYQGLRRNKNGRRWLDLVGFTLQELMEHLEKQFQPGMSWENYGKWHIDHIIPVAAFHFERDTDIDFRRCWSLDNLRPLWADENRRKHTAIIKPFQPTLFTQLKNNRPLDKNT
jgi:hypothetical protein